VDLELAYNASAYEIFDVLGREGGEGLGLDPFGEVVNSDQEEFCLSFPRLKKLMMSIL